MDKPGTAELFGYLSFDIIDNFCILVKHTFCKIPTISEVCNCIGLCSIESWKKLLLKKRFFILQLFHNSSQC